MKQLKTILVATDHSPTAGHAAMRAGMLGRQSGARIELVHVAAERELSSLRRLGQPTGEPLELRVLAQLQAATEAQAAEVAARSGARVEARTERGSLPQTVLDRAEALDADLIVVGARGASFLRDLLLGSNAERLVRKTRRPVLLVRELPHQPYRRALVPVDFSSWSLPALQGARRLCPDGEVSLLHAFNVPFEGKLRYAGVDENTIHRYRQAARQEALEKASRLIADAGPEPALPQVIVAHGDPEPLIEQHAEQLAADLIVIGRQGASLIEALLLGSVTKHVLLQSRCDVLVTQARDAPGAAICH
jgi:nucleotide-binding universal stress UspA family protein